MIRYIKSLIKTDYIKVLIENFTALTLLQVTSYLFPLVTLPYLARVLGVEKFGELAFAAAVIVFFQTFVDFGFNYTAVRDISRVRNDKEKVNEVFSNVMSIRLILIIISLGLFFILTQTFTFLRNSRTVLWCSFLIIPSRYLFADWYFQAIEKMRYITILDIISQGIFTVLVFIIIKKEEQYILRPVLTSLGYLVSGSISQIIIYKRFKVRIILPSLKQMTKSAKGSADVFLSLFLPNLFTNITTIFLKTLSGQYAAGIYDAANKFIQLTTRFTNVLSRTFFPFLARMIDKHKYYVKINFIVNLVISMVLFFGSDLLIKLFYTEEFRDSILVLKILSLSPVFMSFMNSFGANWLVLMKKDYILRNIIAICSIAGALFSYFAVKLFGYIGAAVAITSILGFLGLLTWYFAYRVKVRSVNSKQSKNR